MIFSGSRELPGSQQLTIDLPCVRYNLKIPYLTAVRYNKRKLYLAMRPIPLNFLTMYADLAQGFEFAAAEAGSITTRKIKGKSYLYVTSKDGAIRRQRSLGPADDPRAQEEASRIAAAAERARNMRTVVSTLKQK